MKAAASTYVNQLIDKKTYRAIPDGLMRYVNATSTLNDCARVVWYSLWELCAMEPERQRRLTLGFLSKRLGKSEATIRRCVNQLKTHGWLEVVDVFDVNQRQLPSLYRVTAPHVVVAGLISQTPDRKSKQHVNQSSDIRSANTKVEPHVNQIEPGYICADKDQDLVNQMLKDQSLVDAFTEEVDQSIENLEMVDAASTSKINVSTPKIVKTKLEEMIDRARMRSIFSSNAKKTKRHNDVLLEADRSLYANTEARPKSANSVKICSEGEGDKIENLRGCKSVTQEIIPKEENNKTTQLPETEKGGLRFWIYRQLKKQSWFNSDPWRYVDEIAVSIEKGSLKKFELTHGLNIALKLIREGRWAAPRFVV